MSWSGEMNLNKLKYFIDLVELGSFTKVAEKNFVSQTNVTKLFE